MPPARVIAVGQRSGFREFRVFPHSFDLLNLLYADPNRERLRQPDKRTVLASLDGLLGAIELNGILVMVR